MKNEQLKEQPKMPLTKYNYILMLIGLVVVATGFMMMAGGGSSSPSEFNAEELFSFRRITIAPIVVLFGLGFEVYAILILPKKKQEEQE